MEAIVPYSLRPSPVLERQYPSDRRERLMGNPSGRMARTALNRLNRGAYGLKVEHHQLCMTLAGPKFRSWRMLESGERRNGRHSCFISPGKTRPFGLLGGDGGNAQEGKL